MPDPGLKQEIAEQAKGAQEADRGFEALASVTNMNATQSTETVQGDNFAAAPTVYRYPLDGAADFPAMMQFKVRTVDGYVVDPAEYAQFYDVPLLARAMTSLGLTNSEAKNDQLSTSSTNPDIDSRRGVASAADDPSPFAKGGEETPLTDLTKASTGKAQEALTQDRNPRQDGATGLKTLDPLKPVVIRIYMPQSLVVNDDISYNQENLGTRGLVATAALNSGSGIVNAIGTAVGEGLESIFNLATGQITAETANVAAARVANRIPLAGLRAASLTALQTGVNPGTRMIFDRPNVRQFTFQFRFIATSAAEASQVENIVKSFRTEMYPESVNLAEGIPAGYRFPNLFEISFKFLNSNARFPKIQLAYLRSCQVNYNGSQMSFHADGQPTEVDMTLIFQEYRALSKQDIERGY